MFERFTSSSFTAGFLALVVGYAGTSRGFGDDLTIDEVFILPADEIQVAAGQAGVLRTIYVHEGDSVAVDQKLALVDDAEVGLLTEVRKWEQAIAEHAATDPVQLKVAQKAHEVALAELRSLETANAETSGTVAQMQIQLAKARVEKAELDVQAAVRNLEEAKMKSQLKAKELEIAELNRARRTISAPLAGVVVELLARAGEWVEQEQPVARLMRVDEVRVEAFVPAHRVSAALVGRRAVIVPVDEEGVETEYPGIVEFVSPEIEPTDATVLLRVKIPNPHARLRPGQRARLELETENVATAAVPRPRTSRDQQP